MYAEGDGVARDDHKAFDYFSKIVEHFADDDPDPSLRSMASSAFVSVGQYLRAGIASAKLAPDPERAFDLFRYAATFFGDADAQYNVARMYLDGVGVKKDMRQGMNWLDLAARKGHAPAQALLGEMMFNGEAGGAAQRPRGLMYLTLARESARRRSRRSVDHRSARQGAGFGQRGGSPGRRRDAGKLSAPSRLERFPFERNCSNDKKSLNINMLEQALIEKVYQLFRELALGPVENQDSHFGGRVSQLRKEFAMPHSV